MSSQTVLVTGAEGALGEVVAKRFLSAGHRVYGTYFEKAGAPPRGLDGVQWLAADITQAESVRKTIAAIGDVDTYIHCAGGFRWAHLDQTSDQDFDFLLNINLRAAFLLTRELVASMKKRNFGRIVYVSARASMAPPAGMSAYAASKAGLNAMALALADEVKGFNINVNAVLPTIIDTPANRREMPKADFNTWVTREELSEIIYSLTQSLGAPLNGALIPVSGRL